MDLRVVLFGAEWTEQNGRMLCSADPLDRPKRVVVAGLYHGAEWIPRPEFLADVDLFTREPTWVTERQYRDARPLLSTRADPLVAS